MEPRITEINKEKPKYILFDVYETLLDMTDVERKVNNLLDSKRGYTVWFEMFMQYCFVDNCTGQFHDFTSIGVATMKMAGSILGRIPGEAGVNDVLELLRHLPVHEDVQQGLSQLDQKGYRLAALTNTPSNTVLDRMERTGLISYFDPMLSAEQVKKYKPAVEVYQWAAKQCGVDLNEILMVTAHGWDLAGASNAGMRTAYVKKTKQMLYPLSPQPEFVCKSVLDLAGQLE